MLDTLSISQTNTLIRSCVRLKYERQHDNDAERKEVGYKASCLNIPRECLVAALRNGPSNSEIPLLTLVDLFAYSQSGKYTNYSCRNGMPKISVKIMVGSIGEVAASGKS